MSQFHRACNHQGGTITPRPPMIRNMPTIARIFADLPTVVTKKLAVHVPSLLYDLSKNYENILPTTARERSYGDRKLQ